VRPDLLENKSDAAQVQHAQSVLRDGAFGLDDAGEATETENALLETSGAVRAAFSQPRVLAHEEDEARRAFPTIHAQLMETIQKDSVRHPEKTARVLASRPPFRWNVFPLKLALVAIFFSVSALGGHFIGSKSATRELPVQSLVDDFDDNLRSGAPLEFVADEGQSPQQTAQRISENVGLHIDAPPKKSKDVRLLGARRHSLWSRPGVQAHYLKNGVPFSLYKIRETRCALDGLREVEVNGRTYLQGQRGNYHVVVWRNGDDVTTMVSPLLPRASLALARVMREGNTNT
jgi:hypothetical protein